MKRKSKCEYCHRPVHNFYDGAFDSCIGNRYHALRDTVNDMARTVEGYKRHLKDFHNVEVD